MPRKLTIYLIVLYGFHVTDNQRRMNKWREK